MHAWSTSMLHSAFMLSMVKMQLKVEVGGPALNTHGNYIVDHGIPWKNHGILFLNFCGNPEYWIFISVCSCVEAVGDDVTVLTNSSLENLKKTDRCLRVLENVGITQTYINIFLKYCFVLNLVFYTQKKKYQIRNKNSVFNPYF